VTLVVSVLNCAVNLRFFIVPTRDKRFWEHLFKGRYIGVGLRFD